MPKLHGKRLIDWFLVQDPDAQAALDPTLDRVWRELASGRGHATESVADRLCCAIGLHLCLIPDDLYLPKVDRQTERLIMRDLNDGYWPNEIARLLQLPIGTVRSYA